MTPLSTPGHSFAALNNVALFYQMAMRLIERGPHLPGIGVFSGPSGLGKTYSATFAQNKLRCFRVEVGDSWTRHYLVRSILRELGVNHPKGNLATLVEQIVQIMGEPGHPPLIIDEADKCVDKKMIELVREIHEASQCPIILVGEELLPKKLLQSERTHNRVLQWELAQPCNLDDVRALAKVFARNLNLQDDLLDHIRQETRGVARRIVVNLSEVNEWSRLSGVKAIDKATYTGRIYTGDAPVRRAK